MMWNVLILGVLLLVEAKSEYRDITDTSDCIPGPPGPPSWLPSDIPGPPSWIPSIHGPLPGPPSQVGPNEVPRPPSLQPDTQGLAPGYKRSIGPPGPPCPPPSRFTDPRRPYEPAGPGCPPSSTDPPGPPGVPGIKRMSQPFRMPLCRYIGNEGQCYRERVLSEEECKATYGEEQYNIWVQKQNFLDMSRSHGRFRGVLKRSTSQDREVTGPLGP